MESVLEGWVRCSWSWGLCVLWRCFPYKGTASARVAWADTRALQECEMLHGCAKMLGGSSKM